MKSAICFLVVLLVCTVSALPAAQPYISDRYRGSNEVRYRGDNAGTRPRYMYQDKMPSGLVDEQELENMRARVYGLGGADQPAPIAFDEGEIRMSEVYGLGGADQPPTAFDDSEIRMSEACRGPIAKKSCEVNCANQGKTCQVSTCSCV